MIDPLAEMNQKIADAENNTLIEAAAQGHKQACRILANTDNCYHCVKMAAKGWIAIDLMIKYGKIGVTMCGLDCSCIFVTRWSSDSMESPSVQRAILAAQDKLRAMDAERAKPKPEES